MKCDELRIENACVYGPDAKVYLAEQVDTAIAELKDKCQMHDFFWEGCGFAKRGFKNTIAVSEAFDRLEAENAELKQKLEDAKATAYTESVDAGMRERRLRRALYKTCVNWMTNRQGAMRCYDLEARAKKFDKAIAKCRAKAEEYR